MANLFNWFSQRERKKGVMKGVTFEYTQGVGSPGKVSSAEILREKEKALLYWVFVAIDIIAKQFFSLKYQLIDNRGQVTVDDRVEKFMKRPNPFETGGTFFYRIAFQLEATGKCFIRKREDNKEINFYLLPDPTAAEVLLNEDRSEIKGYRYRHVGGTTEYGVDEIIYLRYPDPYSNFGGYSRMLAIVQDINLQIDVKNIMREIISRPVPRQALSIKDYAYAKSIKESLTMARVQNSIPILPEAQSVILERTPQELQILEINKEIRDTIFQEFGVPPAVVGVYEDINRANALAAERTFIRNTITPRVKFVEQFLNVELIDEALGLKGYYLELKIPEIVDEEVELRKIEMFLRNGVMTINEVRKLEGLEEVSWGNRPYMPAAYIPLSINGISGGSEKRAYKGYEAEDVNTKYWYEVVKRMTTREQMLVREWKKLFKEQKEGVLTKILGLKSTNGIQKQLDEFILLVLNDVAEERERNINELLSELYSENQNAYAGIYNLVVPQVNPQFVSAAMRKVSIIDAINTTTLNELRDAIAESIRLGESVKELAQRIEAIFDFAEEYRSIRIARTELIGCSNMAAMDVLVANDVEFKEWFTALDELVRPSHRALHGQIKRVNEAFVSPVTGESLLYPGDPDADASEVINCRCVVIPAQGGD